MNSANVLRCWICEFPANSIKNMYKVKGEKISLCSEDCHKIFMRSITAHVDPQKTEQPIVIPRPIRFSEKEVLKK